MTPNSIPMNLLNRCKPFLERHAYRHTRLFDRAKSQRMRDYHCKKYEASQALLDDIEAALK